MSQIDNKVKWCLSKAEKELSLGKSHRGLIKTKEDIDGAKKHIIKAEHNLKATVSFGKMGFSDWSASAAFYTIYHCFLGILAAFGYESRNQECTIALIEQLKINNLIELSDDLIDALRKIDSDSRQESNVISSRETFQYGTETSINEDTLKNFEFLGKLAIDETKHIIYSLNNS